MSGDHNMNQSDSGWRKRQIALDKKAENARELGLDYEPSAWLVEFENGEQELHFDEQSVGEVHTPLYTTPPAAQPKQERNFCPRCGKRVGDYIHTCTPPQEKYTYGTPLLDAMTKDYLSPQRTWVGLTEDERINISYEANGNECVAVELTETKLKEKNT